jgi:hypothetical protein
MMWTLGFEISTGDESKRLPLLAGIWIVHPPAAQLEPVIVAFKGAAKSPADGCTVRTFCAVTDVATSVLHVMFPVPLDVQPEGNPLGVPAPAPSALT